METFVGILVSAFGIMLIAEFGDKTNLIALSLMTESQRPYYIAFFSTIGIALSTVFSVLVGSYLGNVFQDHQIWIRLGAALIFIFLGIWSLFEGEDDEEEHSEDNVDTVDSQKVPWYKPVYLVALAEFGDKSQLAVITGSALTYPWAIFIGSTLAMGIIMFSTALLGSLFFEKIDEEVLEKIAAGLFIVAGLWIGLSTLLV